MDPKSQMPPLPHSATAWCFGALWLFIAIVSVHDGYLVVLASDVIADTEQNPLGKFLIRSNNGEIWLFLLVKAAGTVIVSTMLLRLYIHRPTMAFAVAGPLSCFQFLLLVYLTFG